MVSNITSTFPTSIVVTRPSGINNIGTKLSGEYVTITVLL